MEIANIPHLPSREQRFEEITVDCYNEDEALSAFEVYLTDALQTPFAARWGTPGAARQPVTVLDDYRAFVAEGGLPFDDDEEEEEDEE